jgi:Ca2+-transporting ATPase
MIGAQALYQTIITLTLHFVGPKALAGIDDHVTKLEFKYVYRISTAWRNLLTSPDSTLVFNVFVWCQIFNMINCRKLDNSFNIFAGLHRNFWLLGILAISAFRPT